MIVIIPIAIVLLIAIIIALLPIDEGVQFQMNYVPTWAFVHIKKINDEREIQLTLDKLTGTSFQLSGTYVFGHFGMQMKLIPCGYVSAVTTFYVSS